MNRISVRKSTVFCITHCESPSKLKITDLSFDSIQIIPIQRWDLPDSIGCPRRLLSDSNDHYVGNRIGSINFHINKRTSSWNFSRNSHRWMKYYEINKEKIIRYSIRSEIIIANWFRHIHGRDILFRCAFKRDARRKSTLSDANTLWRRTECSIMVSFSFRRAGNHKHGPHSHKLCLNAGQRTYAMA